MKVKISAAVLENFARRIFQSDLSRTPALAGAMRALEQKALQMFEEKIGIVSKDFYGRTQGISLRPEYEKILREAVHKSAVSMMDNLVEQAVLKVAQNMEKMAADYAQKAVEKMIRDQVGAAVSQLSRIKNQSS